MSREDGGRRANSDANRSMCLPLPRKPKMLCFPSASVAYDPIIDRIYDLCECFNTTAGADRHIVFQNNTSNKIPVIVYSSCLSS